MPIRFLLWGTDDHGCTADCDRRAKVAGPLRVGTLERNRAGCISRVQEQNHGHRECEGYLRTLLHERWRAIFQSVTPARVLVSQSRYKGLVAILCENILYKCSGCSKLFVDSNRFRHI